MTLFWHQTGPLMKFENGMLLIEDLNPEVKTRWRMSRMEMLRLGWRCILAGASLEMVRHAATHSDISQTADYDRDQATATANVMRLRVEARNKPKTE